MRPALGEHDGGEGLFPVQQWRLTNGLRVVLQSDPTTTLVAAMMCYDAGSRHDPASRSGLAHFCEHLAFDGPRSASRRSFPRRVEGLGAWTQAFTMTDRLSFSSVFPRRALAEVLQVEAARMTRPIDPDDHEGVDITRRILLEELRERSQSRTRAAAFEHIHRQLFPVGHPYHRPPVGEPDDIRAVSAEDVEAFVRRHFAPSNAVLVLVGDVSVASTGALVEAAFGALPAGQAAIEQHLPATAGATTTPVSVPAAVSEARSHVAWSVAGFGQPGWYHASLLMRALAAGRSSPLAHELVHKSGLAREVSGHLVTMRDSSTLILAASAARGVTASRLEDALRDATGRLLQTGLSEALLARARKKALSDHYFMAQGLDRRVDLCASYACYLDAPEQLTQAAQHYLAPDTHALAGFAASLSTQPPPATVSLLPRAEAA